MNTDNNGIDQIPKKKKKKERKKKQHGWMDGWMDGYSCRMKGLVLMYVIVYTNKK